MEENEQELSTQERLESILIRVKNGQSLRHILKSEKLWRWFYHKLDPQQRLPIIQTRRAIWAASRENKRAADAFVVISLSLSQERKGAFLAMCDQLGTTMTHRIIKLIGADLKQFRDSQNQQSS